MDNVPSLYVTFCHARHRGASHGERILDRAPTPKAGNVENTIWVIVNNTELIAEVMHQMRKISKRDIII